MVTALSGAWPAVVEEAAMGVVDATRAYMTAMRQGSGLTQDDAAELIGVTVKSWRDYEKGKTRDLRYSDIITVLRAVGGSFADLDRLAQDTASPADGAQLAALRLRDRALVEVGAIESVARGAELATRVIKPDEAAELRRLAEAASPQRRARAIAALRLMLEEG